MPGHDIIVVGASAGGVEALIGIVATLPRKLSAAVFIVLHIPAQSPSLLPTILKRFTSLEAIHPEDGAKIEHGYIYVAPPDHHMLIEQGKVRIVRGPKENRHRPAVDPLFRSAANVYGSRVVGVVLTGSRDDGTAGLLAIKRCGGIAVNTVNLSPKWGKKGQESSKSGIMSERKKKELSDVQITANGCR